MKRRTSAAGSLVNLCFRNRKSSSWENWERRDLTLDSSIERHWFGTSCDAVVSKEGLRAELSVKPSRWWIKTVQETDLGCADHVNSTATESLRPSPSQSKGEGGHSVSSWALSSADVGDFRGSIRVSGSGSHVEYVGVSEEWSRLLEEGRRREAVQALDFMGRGGSYISADMLYRLLKESITHRDLEAGKYIHALTARSGHEVDTFLGNHLIRMYASHGKLLEARGVFNKLPAPNVFVWASLISAHADRGHAQRAIELYQKMRDSTTEPNDYIFVAVLKACASKGDLTSGKLVHEDVLDCQAESNLFVASALIHMYANCGSLEDAYQVFERLSTRNVVIWNVMIAGYAQYGLGAKALETYNKMLEEGLSPNDVTYVSILKACGSIGGLQDGKQIHAQILAKGLHSSVFIGSSLMNMYGQCGSLQDAEIVFDGLVNKNVVTWNSMIARYAQHGLGHDALRLYSRMLKDGILPDLITFVSILKACASIGAMQDGKQIHGQILKRGLGGDAFVGSALMNMYVECDHIDDARIVFDGLSEKDVVTWTIMIAGYAQRGQCQEALDFFQRMKQAGVFPDNVIFANLLQMCASTGALQDGKKIHAEILKKGLEADDLVSNALLDMYAKCGSLEDARKVFDRLSQRDVVTWNALINAYSQHDDSNMAIQCLKQMQCQGVEPDATTFTCLLVACSRKGLINEGKELFRKMTEQHRIVPSIEHFTCMVDILARSGQLEEAENMLQALPFERDCVGWRSLLSACNMFGNVELGRRCFDQLVQIDPHQAAVYVLMSKIYADAGRQQEAEEIDKLRKLAGAQKKPAKAVIEVDQKVHEFIVGDQRDDTSTMLQNLNLRMKEQGHVPETDLLEKEDHLCGHAEKLAIAFGLLNTPENTPLFITKDLRMCDDCHNGSKVISRLEGREIVVRDAHRVHHFKDGLCSCCDNH